MFTKSKLFLISTVIITASILFSSCSTSSPNVDSTGTLPEPASTEISPQATQDEKDLDPDVVEPTATDEPTPAGPIADVIFSGGTILTMDEENPLAEALAVKEGLILAVGSQEEVLQHLGPQTLEVDLGGRTMTPGFVDAHNHLYGRSGEAGQEIFSTYDFDGGKVYGTGMEGNQQEALSHGITAMGELAVDRTLAEVLIDFDQSGKMELRTSMYLVINNSCGDSMGDWYLDFSPDHEYSDRLRIGGVKIYADGGHCNTPAVSFNFPSGLGKGDLYFTEDRLVDLFQKLDQEGYQIAIHTLGDRSLHVILNTFERLQEQGQAVHHRIEHNAVIAPADITRYQDLEVTPVIFGLFPTCYKIGDFQLKFDVPEEYQTWEWPWRQLLDANPGVLPAWHSDWPFSSLHPLEQLHGFVTRKAWAGDGSICEPTEDIASGIISIEEALEIMTLGSARVLRQDHLYGSLEEGKYADLVVLSANPLEVAVDQLLEIDVLMTMIAGETLHCADGWEAICPSSNYPQSNTAPSQQEEKHLEGENIASGKGVTASNALGEDPPENVVDGDLHSIWNAGGDPPQWIEIDLGENLSVAQIQLHAAQYPGGDTEHALYGKPAEGNYQALVVVAGHTEDGQVLVVNLPQPYPELRYLKILTTQSPSWVAWYEIEVIAPE